MPGKAAKVTITERQQTILMEFSKSRSEPLMLVQRAKIILLAFDRQSNEEIAVEVRLNRQQVGTWRRRWADAWEGLTVLECGDPRQLREGIRDVLRDAPRPGWSGTFMQSRLGKSWPLPASRRTSRGVLSPTGRTGRFATKWSNERSCQRFQSLR